MQIEKRFLVATQPHSGSAFLTTFLATDPRGTSGEHVVKEA